MKTNNKCEKIKFQHAWNDSTPNIVYTTNPPRSPDKQQTCSNCGLIRTFREKREAWIEYSDGLQRVSEFQVGTMTVNPGVKFGTTGGTKQ